MWKLAGAAHKSEKCATIFSTSGRLSEQFVGQKQRFENGKQTTESGRAASAIRSRSQVIAYWCLILAASREAEIEQPKEFNSLHAQLESIKGRGDECCVGGPRLSIISLRISLQRPKLAAPNAIYVIDFIGAPERIRTSGLCLRRAALYPAELRVPARLTNRNRSGPQWAAAKFGGQANSSRLN